MVCQLITPIQRPPIIIHKIPSLLSELIQLVESYFIKENVLVGFGRTKKEQEQMLLMAVLEQQKTAFIEKLEQQLFDYYTKLSGRISSSADLAFLTSQSLIEQLQESFKLIRQAS